jgi:hypothetical protein
MFKADLRVEIDSQLRNHSAGLHADGTQVVVDRLTSFIGNAVSTVGENQ